ncbi:cyclic nucleotide-binding domain-containing protein [Sphingobacterium tabacisoli]|uniref:Crp/Fnr family transcriptional regulator n=1 Tax=Sphingobacterium tabacisoli TaxID=2044855 RepID=A0ABW5L0M6_9SPHI|nr:hypothetical protein [Sphingobacterium tabacisoli]
MTKAQQKAIDGFLAHWAKYTDIQPYHKSWIERHATYSSYARGKSVYDSTLGEKQVFYVCSGLIGRVHTTEIPLNKKKSKEIDKQEEPKTKRSIFSVGVPQMALMSTEHLYSNTPATGDIKALRPSKIITISYEQIKRFMRDDASLDGMLYALSNKKKRQLARLRQSHTIKDPQSRYICFAETLPELHTSLSQTEQQDLLDISRRSISRATYRYATGKPKR